MPPLALRFAETARGWQPRGLEFYHIANKKAERAYAHPAFLVGVSGFEPEASWTRTKRDTKLRHTPLTLPL